MKKTLQYICAVVLTVTMGACNQSMEPEEIFETQKSGVVLVLNKFYYQVEMPSGQKLYFTGLDSNGELQGFTADEEEVKQEEPRRGCCDSSSWGRIRGEPRSPRPRRWDGTR